MNEQADQVVFWILLAFNLVALIVLFLKGRYAVIILSLSAAFLSPVAIFGTYWHHIITEPLQWWPLVALFRLGKPSSRWADRFYNESKMQRARERYPTANPVPRSLRKQAIRNLRAIERGDYSALHKEAAEAAENEWKVIADRLGAVGWTWGCTARVDSNGKTTFVADAHHTNGKRFAVRADDKLTAFSELEQQIRTESGAASTFPAPSASINVSSTSSKEPLKRPIYATVVAAVIVVLFGAAVRQFVNSASTRRSSDNSSHSGSTWPGLEIRKAIPLQPTEPEIRKAIALPEAAAEHYPWKSNIVTTVFWIGEGTGIDRARATSVWDANLAANYGGYDDPDPSARRNYIPAAFIPKLNPFYCALPYNDLTNGHFKPEAPLIIPWFKRAYMGEGQSVCQNRWIAIRKGDRICYAQWEDCGPIRTDHFQYVFGNERPTPNSKHGAGLNVSPAVRDYLGLGPTDAVDWQFVEVRDVPPGPWRSYGDNNHFVLARRQSEQRMMEQKSQHSDESAKK